MIIIGKALAGHFLVDSGVPLVDLPKKYQNPLTDWVALVVAESKAKRALELACRPARQLDLFPERIGNAPSVL